MSPRTEEQNQQLREERRRKIMDAARRVLARRGLAATKITDIAAEAGMSHGLVYHYFTSKDEVFTALVEEAILGATWAMTAAREQPGSPWDRLAWMVSGMLMGVRQSPEHFMIMVQAFTSDSVPASARRLLDEHSPQMTRLLVDMMREGQAAGQVAPGDPLQLATTLIATMNGLAILALQQSGTGVLIPDPEIILRMFRHKECT